MQALLGEGRVGDGLPPEHRHALEAWTGPAVFDVSSIPKDETVGRRCSGRRAGGSGSAGVTHALAAGGAGARCATASSHHSTEAVAGADPRAAGWSDRTNKPTRLNRQWGVGARDAGPDDQYLPVAPARPARADESRGFLIERSGMLICGVLPPEEMPRLALAKDEPQQSSGS